MPMKLLSADDFRSAAKDGGQPDGTVFRFATGDPQDVDGTSRTKRFVFSDATVDHAGDSIDPKGWNLTTFNSNPVALFSHMSWQPPIGRASNVSVQKGQLVGDIEFAAPDVYEFADTIYRLVDGGFLKAVSVGFMPKYWTFTNDKDRPYGIDFKKQTLLEISVCAVPCNPNALGEARAIGIDTAPLVEWAEKVLDTGDTVFLPRKELEDLRGQAASVATPRYYLQTPKSFPGEAAERLRETVKGWAADPNDVLILPEGITLRTVGETQAGTDPSGSAAYVTDEAIAALLDEFKAAHQDITQSDLTRLLTATKALIAKTGRRISASTKATLQVAMGHHGAMGQCIKDLIEDPADDGSNDGSTSDDDLTPQPPGTVVVESDEHLSPEERRLKEVRALRESLPTD